MKPESIAYLAMLISAMSLLVSYWSYRHSVAHSLSSRRNEALVLAAQIEGLVRNFYGVIDGIRNWFSTFPELASSTDTQQMEQLETYYQSIDAGKLTTEISKARSLDEIDACFSRAIQLREELPGWVKKAEALQKQIDLKVRLKLGAAGKT